MEDRFLDTVLFARQAAAQGRHYADEVRRRLPPSLFDGGQAKISADRISRVMERVYQDAQHYRAWARLGWFGKARLAHAFRWGLADLGYPKEFVEMATEALVVYLSKPPATVPELESAQRKRERKAAKADKGFAKSTAKPANKGVAAAPEMAKYNRAHPSPRYQALTRLYRQMHEQGETFLGIPPEQTFPGLSLPPQAARIKRLIDATGSRRILDYGSGKGQQYQARNITLPGVLGQWPSIQAYWGVDEIRCYDPAYPPYAELPSDAYDGVISTDVLEHCPEEDIPWILDEIFSYARKFVFANVACYPAKKRLPTGENAHCTIRPYEWWMNLIRNVAKHYPGLSYEFHVQWKDNAGQLIERSIKHDA